MTAMQMNRTSEAQRALTVATNRARISHHLQPATNAASRVVIWIRRYTWQGEISYVGYQSPGKSRASSVYASGLHWTGPATFDSGLRSAKEQERNRSPHRGFCYSGSAAWNSLPTHLHNVIDTINGRVEVLRKLCRCGLLLQTEYRGLSVRLSRSPCEKAILRGGAAHCKVGL